MINDLVTLRKLDWSYHNSRFSNSKKEALFKKYNEIRSKATAENLGIYLQIPRTDSAITKFSLAEEFNGLREYKGETKQEFKRTIMSWPPIPYGKEFAEDLDQVPTLK